MINSAHKYVLTITCPDTIGIVAAVSGFLTDNDAFITEAAQFGDPFSNRFFMRIVFTSGALAPPLAELEKKFAQIANRFQMIWRIHEWARRARLLITVSKFGHCLNDLLHRYNTGTLPVSIVAVVSNHQDMRSLVDWHGIPYYYLPATKDTKAAQEARWLSLVDELNVDLVVLARYMQVLSRNACEKLMGRCINIHHSFLPSFKGAKPYHQAHARGVKIIGATAHYVTSDLDEGPIIEQAVERVDHTHVPEDLVAMGSDLESVVLARAVRYHIEHRVLLNGHKTVVFR
ncbi:MAG: formyltetrahydrofolate deformylase [Alphaproteobacteria bacterium]|nr:formyltetrahydrofolate deformylase [Alphaproteobacteria bacterium]